jgi:4-carboxymuconolactone decarboxylase
MVRCSGKTVRDAGWGMRMLEARSVALVRVATAITKGDEALLRQRFIEARGAAVPARWVDELLLQSFLNVGYPLSLMAFGVWREVAGSVAEPGEDLSHDRWAAWRERGAKLCAETYGRTYHKLLLHLNSLHPALEPLVVVDAYGKLLGRPGLEPKLRELCTLAAIALLPTPKQLHAHLRGALLMGWTREEVDEVLAIVEQDLSAASALTVWELWADVRERNL